MAESTTGGGRGERAVAAGACGLAVVLMAWDHLWGNEGGSGGSFPADLPTFFLSTGLVVLAAVVVFGRTVPRGLAHPERAHRSALAHSIIAAVLAVPAVWLGFPVVIAGGGLALGVRGLSGPRRRVALIGVVLAALVMIFAVLATAFPPTDSD